MYYIKLITKRTFENRGRKPGRGQPECLSRKPHCRSAHALPKHNANTRFEHVANTCYEHLVNTLRTLGFLRIMRPGSVIGTQQQFLVDQEPTMHEAARHQKFWRVCCVGSYIVTDVY